MAFPITPTDGQLYKGYIFDATRQMWNVVDPGKYFEVGFTYTQYPGMEDPSTLGWYGTWENISSQFAGDFFRAEGGEATAFGAGEQSDAFQAHGVRINAAGGSSSGFLQTQSTNNGHYANTYYTRNSVYTDLRDAVDDANPARTATETRPINRTIRIWRRTA